MIESWWLVDQWRLQEIFLGCSLQNLNIITSLKNIYIIFPSLFCYYGLKQVLLFGLILLLWMLFELFFLLFIFCYLDFLFLDMVNWVY
jgi:hypothetical protein